MLVEKLCKGFTGWQQFVELHLVIANVMFMTVTVFEDDAIAGLDGNGLRIESVLLLINRVLSGGCGSGNSNGYKHTDHRRNEFHGEASVRKLVTPISQLVC